MAQKHNVEYTEKPMTRDGRLQGPSRRYRRLRHPTFPAALWWDKNPLLQRGEIGIESDTHMAKLGDGHTYWRELPYALKKDYAWGDIVGDIENQTDLVGFVNDAVADEAALRQNADTTLQQNIDAEATSRENADNALSARIATNTADIAQETSDREDADATLQNNINAEESTRISADAALQTQITANTNKFAEYRTSADQDVIDATHATKAALDAETDARESADTTLQNNIDTEEGARINADNALSARIDTTNSNLTAEISARISGDTTLQTNITNETNARVAADTTLQQNIDAEAASRQTADNALQSQIDAIVSKSDVVDIVGTYAELQAYDTTNLGDNDVVKVLSDSTHNNAQSYYRWVIADGVGAWVYIGSESETYTKSETDALLNAKQNNLTTAQMDAVNSGITTAKRTAYDNHLSNTNNPHQVTKAQVGLGNVDNTSDADKPISTATQNALGQKADVASVYTKTETNTLLAEKQDTISDLGTIRAGAAKGATAVQPGDLAPVATSGAYSDLTGVPTIGTGTLTVQKNGTTVATFGANATGNTTANISVPTKTSDITNDSGYLTENSATITDMQSDIAGKQNTLTPGTGIRIEGNVISSTGGVTTDDATITVNASGAIQTVATVNANTASDAVSALVDWVGTYDEYVAQDVENQHPEWICFITDDDETAIASQTLDYGLITEPVDITEDWGGVSNEQ